MGTFVGLFLVLAFLVGLAKLLRADEDKKRMTERERTLGRPRLRVPLQPRDVLPPGEDDDA